MTSNIPCSSPVTKARIRFELQIAVLCFLCLDLVSSRSIRTRKHLEQSLDGQGNRDASSHHRHLQYASFAPLNCNAKLDQARCKTWTNLIGSSATSRSRITIPCGSCVVMNHPGPSLNLLAGIDVQGKLVFPDGYKGLTISAPFFAVQGALEMTASNSVRGIPNVRFYLTSNSSANTVSPLDNNANVCGGGPCDLGSKAIAVLGGQVTIDGIPPSTTVWLPLFDVLSENEIVVENSGVVGGWDVGAEILITSHTRDWNDHQVRTITGISLLNNRLAKIQLNDTIVRPTTYRESSDFATEVALLSRNFVFEGEVGSDPLLGGHFWVIRTPAVIQHLEGVEFRNFGQQGLLGRYPIHFHYCADVSGSTVLKNTVRNSNQRCVVVHGTDKLNVEENIAYNTKGHCYMLEDGIETGNTFYRNLGAQTDRPSRIIPDMGSNGFETDATPSTFWITNPTNKWINNVAAGSIGSGYWFELKIRGEKAPLYANVSPELRNLGAFTGNVAHSNSDVGLRTYPRTGFQPEIRGQLKNLRFFRNPVTGLFIHQSRHIDIVGGVFADNGIAIDIDRTDDTQIIGSLIIGQSDIFAKQGQSACFRSQLAGIELPIFGGTLDWGGTTMVNVTFEGFGSGTCIKDTRPIRISDTADSTMFWGFSSVQGISVESNASSVNFCASNAAGVPAYMVDIDGSFQPSVSSSGAPSTLVAPFDELLHFVPANRCTDVPDGCFKYCKGLCLRTVRYDVDLANSEGYVLRVCQQSAPSNCIDVQGAVRWRDKANESPEWDGRDRMYAVALPRGKFLAKFIDRNGNAAWPTYADVHLQDMQICPTSIQGKDVSLVVPPVSEKSCQSLIKNGDAEASSTAPINWLYKWGGIQVVPKGGIGRSISIAGTDVRSSSALTQFLDSRCLDLMVGRTYEIMLWVKLVKLDGSSFICNPDKQSCPEAGLTWNGKPLLRFATVIPQYNPSDYQLVHGTVDISQEVADVGKVSFYVERNVGNAIMNVDNVSLSLMPEFTPSNPLCANLVFNGNFVTGDARFWTPVDAKANTIVNVGSTNSPNYALKMQNGQSAAILRTGCLVVNKQYAITVRYQLLDARGSPTSCGSSAYAVSSCPRALMAFFDSSGSRQFTDLALTVGTPSTGWNKIYGVFTATSTMVQSSSLFMMMTSLDGVQALIVDDASISLV